MSVTPTPKSIFVEKVQKWVILDTQLKMIHEKTKEMREQKSQLTADICEYMTDHQLAESHIEISDGVIRMGEKKEYPPLTFSYVEECLGKIIQNKDHVNYIMRTLKSNRDVKSTPELRRSYNSKEKLV